MSHSDTILHGLSLTYVCSHCRQKVRTWASPSYMEVRCPEEGASEIELRALCPKCSRASFVTLIENIHYRP
jgi:NAD-dependent SIR2 family protein deacetylase